MRALNLEERMRRSEAINEISNVMGLYCYAHLANDHVTCFALSATRTPGVRVELPMGIYEGEAGLRRLYLDMMGKSDREPAGKMHMHTVTTRIIEVAGDLKTAKAAWMAPGHATDKYGGETFRASWRWAKYGCDFVREDDQWKMWHLHLYGIFGTPYDKSWVETGSAVKPGGPPPLPPEFAPDRPASGFWQYSPEGVTLDEPRVPEPYDTFQEADAY